MSNYEISKSSLLSLKAEILRKQEEVKNKIHDNERNKKKVPLVIKNKGVDERNERDSVEDIELLEKSRIILERKAKLYDKLSKSKVIDDDPTSERNRFLVRFNDKNEHSKQNDNISDNEEDITGEYDDAENSDEEWVNYVDCLGRTRTCLKKDLQYYKSRDKDYVRDKEIDEPKKVVEEPAKSEENKGTDESIENNQLLSDDMRRELLRRQWEKEEMELRDKEDIHYQDVLFNEARTHGVGYYSFSKDEEERRKQQESLEKLRRETQKEQEKAQELKATREKQLAARIKAAQIRKRQRLGLPLEDEEEEEEAEIGPAVPESTKEQPTESTDDKLKERLLEEARKNHVRPWDVGKDKKEFYEYTQQEWVEKQRKERNSEFAPPTTYRRDFRAQPTELTVPKTGGSLQFTTKKTDSKKYFNRYKMNHEDLEDPFNEETRTFNVHNSGEPVKRKYEEYESEHETHIESTSSSSTLTQENNVVAPKIHVSDPQGVTNQNIEASIEAGLKFLRKQSEKRGSIRDAENNDMFNC